MFGHILALVIKGTRANMYPRIHPNPVSHGHNVGMAKVLVVDDEPSIRELLVAGLKFGGFDVFDAASGNAALKLVTETKPDMIVLDVMLPDQDGFTVARTLRARGFDTPIIFLTAKDETANKVRGLTVGGDDYLTKPFSLEELVARIKVILRRSGSGHGSSGVSGAHGLMPDGDDEDIITVGDLELNLSTYEVHRGGVSLELSPTELKLLQYLMENPNRVLSKEQILDRVWHYDFNGDANIVESYLLI